MVPCCLLQIARFPALQPVPDDLTLLIYPLSYHRYQSTLLESCKTVELIKTFMNHQQDGMHIVCSSRYVPSIIGIDFDVSLGLPQMRRCGMQGIRASARLIIAVPVPSHGGWR
ncbi:uncharacterized protein LOC141596419 isoform X3 [Silene latifolia]|uniref:uncharacterized protein LOC141596419 isoform X3 n=1 Tax=Silene latifolia TaxID=37657 RepID=UPI003D783003